MSQTPPTKQEVIAAIQNCFASVVRPGRDHFWDPGDIVDDERREIIDIMARQDWRTVDSNTLLGCQYGLFFFSLDAFLYFLPSYLIASLDEDFWEYAINMIPALSPPSSGYGTVPRWDALMTRLTSEQKRAIQSFLRCMAEQEFLEPEIDETAEHALRYWLGDAEYRRLFPPPKERAERLVRDALATGDWEPVSDWLVSYTTYAYDHGTVSPGERFDEALFEYLLQLLDEEQFLHASHSSTLLGIFDSDWKIMTLEQKKSLLTRLQATYPRLRDPQSWFLTCEILGRFFANAPALAVLQDLARTAPPDARQMLPMGFLKLIRHCPDPALRQTAANEILRLRYDEFEDVREEAALHLHILRSSSPA